MVATLTKQRIRLDANPSKRKKDGESTTRTAILDAAEALMREEGYAAVTSRRVGEAAGLKSKLVHYYFNTMDELFVALYERAEKAMVQRHLESLAAANPLRSLWEATLERSQSVLGPEFIALSNHRKSIRKLIVRTAEQTAALNVACVSRYIKDHELDPEAFPPVVVTYLLSALSQALVREEMLGIGGRRNEVVAFANRWFDRLDRARMRGGK